MGAVHSRMGYNRPKPLKTNQEETDHNLTPSSGYFLLGFQSDKIRIVNAEKPEFNMISEILKQQCHIEKSGWDRNMTYSYKVKMLDKEDLILLISTTVLALYQSGWEPLPLVGAPLKQIKTSPKATICFKRKTPDSYHDHRRPSTGSTLCPDISCICLEICNSYSIGLHQLPNPVLLDLVNSIQKDYIPGVRGVSTAVASVIMDYMQNMPPVLPSPLTKKFVELAGDPWSCDDLQVSILACLTRAGYRLSIDMNINTDTRILFFISDPGQSSDQVIIPDLARDDDHHPTTIRSKTSFFQAYAGRTSQVRRIRNTRKSGVLTVRSVGAEQTWWQQTSTDVASDQESTGEEE